MATFNMKYTIEPRYLTAPSKRRSGQKMWGVKFLVAHDTGNPGSTAAGNVGYYEDSRNVQEASAHLFVDDRAIIECIPTGLLGGRTAEKAWHVLYNVPTDNQMYGVDANDYAIGVEWCYGGKIDGNASYAKYVWVLAYLCYYYGLDPAKHITGHFILDPARKTDPKSGLATMGYTFQSLIQDVVNEYDACLITEQKKEITLNQYAYLKKLSVKDDGEGQWARSELSTCLVTDEMQKSYLAGEQMAYLYKLALEGGGEGAWATPGLVAAFDALKSKGYL